MSLGKYGLSRLVAVIDGESGGSPSSSISLSDSLSPNEA